MNYVILSLTAKFGRAPASKIKLALSSSIGAFYAFVIFFPSLHFLFSIFMKIACSMLIVVAAFTPYKFRDFFRLMGIFYLVTLVFGGAGFAIFYFTSFNGIVSNGIFYITDISLKNIMLASGIGYILINFCWSYIQKQLSKDKVYMTLRIEMDGDAVEVRGLVDTGNSLTDPITKYPVIIVEYDAILKLIPDSIKEIFRHSKSPNYNEIAVLSNDSLWMKRLRVIPFEALGTENGMLVGFKPDSVYIEKDAETKSIKDIIIAIYSKKLSKNGDYKALLHPDLV
jgi:stage II sporulation protein GA (sporulation sigma-E factor processing peptidase)